MNNLTIIKFGKEIDKYESMIYGETDFHDALETLINTFTENELHEARSFLQEIEGNLERADFMLSGSEKRNEYLSNIDRIKRYFSSL